MYWKQFLGLEQVTDQTVTNCFCESGFCNKAQNGVVQTLDQDEDEKFANLVKELAGEVDPDNYVGFEKDIASSMPTVDAGSISGVRKLKKKSLYNTRTQLTRLWMYQVIKT